MNLLDKFLDAMRLNDDDDDDYEFANDDYFDEDEEYEPKKKTPRFERKVQPKPEVKEKERKPEKVRENVRETSRESTRSINKITPIGKAPKKQGTGSNMEVCVIKPTVIDDEREITETLLNGITVIINMEGLNVETAQRIIDFISGSVFAMRGKLQKISNYIFLATPSDVDISGDIQTLMDAFGNGDSGFTF